VQGLGGAGHVMCLWVRLICADVSCGSVDEHVDVRSGCVSRRCGVLQVSMLLWFAACIMHARGLVAACMCTLLYGVLASVADAAYCTHRCCVLCLCNGGSVDLCCQAGMNASHKAI
jgi:hypothetical protein